MLKRFWSLIAAIAMLILVSSFSHSCAPRLLPERPPENYQGSIAEGPILQAEDYWIYQRPDGSRIKVGAGTLLAKVVFPLWVGRVWNYQSTVSLMGHPVTGHRIPAKIECEATAFKAVTVAAGSFEAFECTCRCTVRATGVYEPDCGQWTFWYGPQVKNIVKIKAESTAGTIELLEYKVSDGVSEQSGSQERTKEFTEPSLDANSANAFFNRGLSYYNKKDYGRAIQEYDEAIRLNPTYADAFNNRGNAYRSKGDYDRAIQDYDKAVQLNPNYTAAFNNRGNVYRDKKDYDRAIQDYNQAIRLNPNYALAFNNRGAAYRYKKDYERALADYEAAARIDPKTALHKSIGYTLFYLGRMAQSAEAMDRRVKAAPQDMYAILWRYITQARDGGLQAALRELGENAAKLKEPRWPAPVIDFYLGRIDEKAMYAAAENSDSKRKVEQVCEANFYAAEAKLLKGATEDAIPLLRAAEKNCPPTFYESHSASAELKRLGQK